METGTTIAFISIPYLLFLLADVWPVHLKKRTPLLKTLGRLVLVVATFLLLAGDILLVRDRLERLDPVAMTTGVLAVLVLWVFAFSKTARAVVLSWSRRALDAVRQDFAEPPHAPAKPSRGLGPFLLYVVTFYLLYFTYGEFNYHLKYYVFEYLDLIREWSAQIPLGKVIVAEECAPTRMWAPFTFSLYSFIDRLTPRSYVHICMLVIISIFAVRWYMNRSRPALLLFLSHLFYLAVSVNPDYEYNRTGYFELVFALLFLLNFLMVMHMPPTVPSFFILGLFTGFAFCQKELNIINVAVISYRLAILDLPRPRVRALIVAVAVGFTIPASFLFNFFLRCGMTEGLYHMPFLWFDAKTLRTSLTQTDVHIFIEKGVPFPLSEMLLRRLSFQTVGDFLIGSMSRLVLYSLTGVFPVLWMVANLPRLQTRIVAAYLSVAFLLYGATRWKRGDSSDPLYTMLPFGYVFAAPYMARLVRHAIQTIRSRARPFWRAIYLWALVGLNVWFVGQQVGPLLRTIDDLKHLSGLSASGPVYHPEPTSSEAEVRDLLFQLRDSGQLGRWLFLDRCHPHDVPRSIVNSDLDRHLAVFALWFEFFAAIRDLDVERIRQAFRVMFYEEGFKYPSSGKFWVLACMHRVPPDRPGAAFGSVGPLLGGCVDVVFTDPKGSGLALFSLNLERCRRYLPEDLPESPLPKWIMIPDLPFLPREGPGDHDQTRSP